MNDDEAIKIIDGEIYRYVGDVPKLAPKSCEKCDFCATEYHDVHIGYSCYDKHQFSECEITGETENMTNKKKAKNLFKSCPLQFHE